MAVSENDQDGAASRVGFFRSANLQIFVFHHDS